LHATFIFKNGANHKLNTRTLAEKYEILKQIGNEKKCVSPSFSNIPVKSD